MANIYQYEYKRNRRQDESNDRDSPRFHRAPSGDNRGFLAKILGHYVTRQRV
ncbi:MAG: hypothetical protein NXI22_18095 [bacterium]|nr:hypothetical protein [bacterium]